jgi:hypothetical protein
VLKERARERERERKKKKLSFKCARYYRNVIILSSNLLINIIVENIKTIN